MKLKPEDRKDEHGARVSSIRLLDREGNYVDTKCRDFVCVRYTSSSATANEEGVVDGFTPQRTRVLVKGKYRFYRDENLMFVRCGPSPARAEQCVASPVVAEQIQAVPMQVGAAPPFRGAIPVVAIEDEEPTNTADRKDEINDYFDQLETLMETCMEVTVAMNIHIERGRELFRAHRNERNLEAHLSRIRTESERRWMGFSEFVARIRDEMQADIS